MKTGIVLRDGHLERREQKRNSYNIQCQSSAARHHLEEERIKQDRRMWTVICTRTRSSGGLVNAVMNGPVSLKAGHE
jgi:hypothetical protein